MASGSDDQSQGVSLEEAMDRADTSLQHSAEYGQNFARAFYRQMLTGGNSAEGAQGRISPDVSAGYSPPGSAPVPPLDLLRPPSPGLEATFNRTYYVRSFAFQNEENYPAAEGTLMPEDQRNIARALYYPEPEPEYEPPMDRLAGLRKKLAEGCVGPKTAESYAQFNAILKEHGVRAMCHWRDFLPPQAPWNLCDYVAQYEAAHPRFQRAGRLAPATPPSCKRTPPQPSPPSFQGTSPPQFSPPPQGSTPIRNQSPPPYEPLSPLRPQSPQMPLPRTPPPHSPTPPPSPFHGVGAFCRGMAIACNNVAQPRVADELQRESYPREEYVSFSNPKEGPFDRIIINCPSCRHGCHFTATFLYGGMNAGPPSEQQIKSRTKLQGTGDMHPFDKTNPFYQFGDQPPNYSCAATPLELVIPADVNGAEFDEFAGFGQFQIEDDNWQLAPMAPVDRPAPLQAPGAAAAGPAAPVERQIRVEYSLRYHSFDLTSECPYCHRQLSLKIEFNYLGVNSLDPQEHEIKISFTLTNVPPIPPPMPPPPIPAVPAV